MNRDRLEAEFIDGAHGRLFVLSRGPASAKNVVLVVPPFAEEMNKARRMITEVTCSLARRGTASICVDLFGTGDSEGEFGDSRWDGWIDDLAAVDAWAAARGWPITGLLAVRLGCALAASYVGRRRASLDRWVFWQPVLDGTRCMDQFLRLKLAAGMLGQGPKRTVADLRDEIRASGSLEVAGYDLSAELLAGIDAVRLVERVGAPCPPLHWFELVHDVSAPLPIPATRLIEKLRDEGCEVQVQAVASAPIWTSTEIVVSEALAESTVQALCA